MPVDTKSDVPKPYNLLKELIAGGAVVSKAGVVRKDPQRILQDERAQRQIKALKDLIKP